MLNESDQPMTDMLDALRNAGYAVILTCVPVSGSPYVCKAYDKLKVYSEVHADPSIAVKAVWMKAIIGKEINDAC